MISSFFTIPEAMAIFTALAAVFNKDSFLKSFDEAKPQAPLTKTLIPVPLSFKIL